MELELSRVDYTLVGVTSNNCMKLLPGSGLKEPQKVNPFNYIIHSTITRILGGNCR